MKTIIVDIQNRKCLVTIKEGSKTLEQLKNKELKEVFSEKMIKRFMILSL